MQPLWRTIQRQNFTDWKKLFTFLELGEEHSQKVLSQPRFILNLPLRLAEKIAKGKFDDPILRQFLPLVEESEDTAGFLLDPVGDGTSRKESKLLHKYRGRALLVCTSACAMHCRFCFRQHFDYDSQDTLFDEELEIIRNDSSLSEIILSGGDPLSVSDPILGKLIERLSSVPHLKRLRFHTRFPIGIPERLDDSFLKILEECPLQVFFIIHCNHPTELDETILAALKKVQKLGIPVLNQSVLLKGVNDDLATLKSLSECLIDNGILPYYLHQLDRVQGAAHFEVDKKQGNAIVQELAKELSGYGVPRYVREIAGEKSKTNLEFPSSSC